MRFGKLVGTVKVSVAGSVLALAVAGCTELTPTGGLPDTPSSAATSAAPSTAAPTSVAPTTSAAPTTTYTPEEQAVIDQYKGYYNAFYSMSTFDEPSIRAAFGPYTSPNFLTKLVDVLIQQFAQQGKHPQGQVTFGQVSITITGEEAIATECRDGSTELVLADSDGSVVGQGKPGTSYETRLNLLDGKWLVTKAGANEIPC